MPRAYWKGYLKLSLVSCPIAINPAASSSERISFRQINKKTGNRLRQQLVDEVTREPVEAADKGRGFEVDKNQYLLIEDDEVEALEIESSHAIDIESFVPAAEIDKRYYDSPYYIAPTDEVGQGSVCGYSRGDARQGHGRPRPHRTVAPRTRDRARADGQGAARHDAALSVRDQEAGGIFRRHRRREDRSGNEKTRRAHHREEGSALRSKSSSRITTKTRWPNSSGRNRRSRRS